MCHHTVVMVHHIVTQGSSVSIGVAAVPIVQSQQERIRHLCHRSLSECFDDGSWEWQLDALRDSGMT